MRRLVTGCFAALAVALLALPVLAEPARTPTRTVTPERWRISGNPQSDGCGGRLVLAARHLTFTGRTMHADVVDRTYALTRRGDERVADGHFDSDAACPGTRVYERWDLRQVASGILEGTLSSTWRLTPRCEECVVVFQIRAERVQ